MSTVYFFCLCFFKQKTAYEMRISDWSSDLCSSDLILAIQRVDVIGEMRPVLMAGDLGLLPGAELGIGLPQLLFGLGLQPLQLVGNVCAAVGRQLLQLGDLRLEFGDRLLEFQIGVHGGLV